MAAFPSFTWHHSPSATLNSLEPSLSAQGKVVLISGAGSGIGKATAIAFAEASARAVIILGRTQSTLDGAKAEIEEAAQAHRRAEGFQCLAFRADIADAKTIDDIFAQVVQTCGKIDVLVSNAGYLNEHRVLGDSDLTDYWKSFETNVKGALVLIQAFLKTHPQQTSTATPSTSDANSASVIPPATAPVIINISSGVVHIPPSMLATFSAYAASKLAALNIFTFLQAEYPNLSVFNLQPGEIPTAMAKKGHRDLAKDDVRLPAHWCVWLAAKAGSDAEFLKGRFVWGNWDVDELCARRAEVQERDLLKMELKGWGSEFVETYGD